jgi:hypothetical protein
VNDVFDNKKIVSCQQSGARDKMDKKQHVSKKGGETKTKGRNSVTVD